MLLDRSECLDPLLSTTPFLTHRPFLSALQECDSIWTLTGHCVRWFTCNLERSNRSLLTSSLLRNPEQPPAASELGVAGNLLTLRPWHWREQNGWCQPFNCIVSREWQSLSSRCYVTVSVIRVPSAGRCLWSKVGVGGFPGSVHKRKLEFANSMNPLGFRLMGEWWPEMVFFLTFLLCVRGKDERLETPVSSRSHLYISVCTELEIWGICPRACCLGTLSFFTM